jgi:5-methyltetrahydrofolate--homocysteine methyltransferase
VPETAEKRFKLGEKIFRRALTAGIAREDIYLDGLTLAVSAENRAPEVTLKTIELFKQELGAKTVLGVSNVSFGLPRRAEVNAAFLTMALQRGLSLPIVNPYSRPILDAIRLADLLLGKDLYGKAFLASAEEKEREEALKPMVEEEKPIAEQLFDAVLFGNSEGISGLVRKALKAGLGAMEINDKVLVPAMEEVGRRYDRKKFFLPQVILAAEAMRTAFIALKAHIPAAAEKSKGTILLATVRGDVHDIGKNLVAALVENHGYRVVDLGKNVSAIEIINRAEAEKADVIGLSALLTTTMLVMKETVAELRAAVGAKIIVGGAVVTRKFAQEIGADGYGKDASEAVKEIDRLSIPTLEQGNQKSR